MSFTKKGPVIDRDDMIDKMDDLFKKKNQNQSQKLKIYFKSCFHMQFCYMNDNEIQNI